MTRGKPPAGRERVTEMLYEFLVVRGGYEQRVSFSADTEQEAREKAAEWVGENGTVADCVGRASQDY
jgi:hypothetical protein